MTERERSAPTATSDLVEGTLFYPIALVVSATIFPGLTLCIPGLIFFAAFLLIPLLAVAVLVGIAAAIVAAPVMLVRGIRELVRRRSAASEQTADRLVPLPSS